jgi:aminoglycoside phosphotransferase (APT) family kinase protein
MTDETALNICVKSYGRAPDALSRLRTGSCNYVYSFEYEGKKNILRISSNAEFLKASIYWIGKLSRLALPVPKIEFFDADNDPPFAVLSYIEGEDLGQAYPHLSAAEKKGIAGDIVRFQKELSSMPPARGFGFLKSYEDPDVKGSWAEVVRSHIERSRTRIAAAGIFFGDYCRRAGEAAAGYEAYFSHIEPLPFFDDATTKNVLVSKGKLNGIIDLDWVCFGDPVYAIALTRMSLLASGCDLLYIDYWVEAARLNGSQKRALSLYTLIFCVDFMSEKGMKFNRDAIEQTSDEETAKYQNLFEVLYREVV